MPGLYYVGLMRQRNAASATLRGVGPDARVVVDHLRWYCHAAQSMISAQQAGAGQEPGRGMAGLLPTMVLGNRYAAVHRY